MISVYKIKFTKDSFELNEDYERLSDLDKEKIVSMNAFAFFDYEEEDSYTFFVLVEPLEIKPYFSVLDENLIAYNVIDYSEEVLNGKYDIEGVIRKYVKKVDTLRYKFFIQDLEEWIYDHLDIDTVLDRISEVGGIKNLRKVEKKFLKNYNL